MSSNSADRLQAGSYSTTSRSNLEAHFVALDTGTARLKMRSVALPQMKTLSVALFGFVLAGGVVFAGESPSSLSSTSSSSTSNEINNHQLPELSFSDAFAADHSARQQLLDAAAIAPARAIDVMHLAPRPDASDVDPRFSVSPSAKVDARLLVKKPDHQFDYKLIVKNPTPARAHRHEPSSSAR